MMNVIETDRALSTNRAGWDRVAPKFHGGTALPEYGPLAPTEDSLGLLDDKTDLCALELGCGSGHSLRYLAVRGARELWGVDLSPVQVAFAEETLRPFAPRVRLFESAMEVNPGIPSDHFDLVFSIYGLGWTTDLPTTMGLITRYLRPGGCFIVSGEHPVYGCLEWNGKHYTVSEPYFTEGPREHASWKGGADRDSSTHPEHLRGRDHPGGPPARGAGRNATQSGRGERRACRSRALVLCRSSAPDANHLHHQSPETVFGGTCRPTTRWSRRRLS